ncbi:MAG TPA: gliding motility-associated C-terminal domain-containing protein [Chitinophaga sp.]|uniref:gliding motility-associated C-terminal domain-containing protein n=1 Tax=Chitinophaga sp. TaxID=1869181 RepID=UPI002CB8E229|nr:gliding motility-associated C-terminal domain-containing protein [Chitinophaga sp.]HVI44683.1 gliding motility-associated C-terminal domain-containing protein [Chitinophaga sp.]
MINRLYLNISTAVCFLGGVLSTSAQTAVNKGELHISGNTVVYFGDHFTNDGNYHNSGQVTFKKNMTNNGTMAANDTGTTFFNGAVLQQIAGTQPGSFFHVVMNSVVNGIAYNLSNEMNVRKDMDFTNGVMKTTLQGWVTFLNGARAINPSDKSHVSGKVKKTGNESFVYPIGNDSYYRPAGISAPTDNNETIAAEYFFRNGSTSPFDPQLTDGRISGVNKNEYWVLDRESGRTPVTVTLTWNAGKTATMVASLPGVLVARWNGSKWESGGASNPTGNNNEGAVSSGNALTALGPFTFSEALRKALIGLAQLASEPKLEADQTYTVTITLILRNMGDVPLDSVMLSHNLSNTFPYPMKFRRVGPVKQSDGLVLNDGFDGNADIQLLKELSQLAPQQQDTVSFTLNITPDGRYGTFYSSAQVAGKNGDVVVKDISNDKEIMPPNNNGDPTNYNDPTPITLKEVKLKIPEGISPNGDGRNDRFVIEGLDPTAQVDMKIVNRWGDVVYENADYKNNWEGRSNRGLRVGDILPDGTYYYVITIKDKVQTNKVQRFVGFLTLMR